MQNEYGRRLGLGRDDGDGVQIAQIRGRSGRPAYPGRQPSRPAGITTRPERPREHDKGPSHPSNVTTPVYALSAYAPYCDLGNDDAQGCPLQPSFWTR